MKKALLFIIFALTIGCATQLPHVSVNAYLNPSLDETVSPQTPLCMQENADASNLLFEKNLIAQAESLWKEKGYTITSCEEASYILTFEYGMGDKTWEETMRLFPSFDILFYPRLHLVFSGFTFLPDRRQVTVHWLIARLQKPEEVPQPASLLWMAEVAYLSPKADLRKAMGPLLYGAVTFFGKDTGEAVEVTLPPSLR